MSRIVIFGVGDYARILATYLDQDSPHEVVAFTVHERYLDSPHLLDRPVIAFETLAERFGPADVQMMVAIGFSGVNRRRSEMVEECRGMGYTLASYVCSKAITWDGLAPGDNTVIFEANVIQPFVSIGSNVILWSGNHIGHDTVIEDDVFIASHVVVSGNCRIGRRSFVGVNATFRDGITVAPDCIIGAGAVIMKDTQPGEVYAVRGTEPRARKSWELRGF